VSLGTRFSNPELYGQLQLGTFASESVVCVVGSVVLDEGGDSDSAAECSTDSSMPRLQIRQSGFVSLFSSVVRLCISLL
jgi:hypothetical protein